jgi:NADH dehydrogenase
MVLIGLVARYGVHLYRTPVPIVGDVPAIRPSKAQRRRLTPEQRAAADADAGVSAGVDGD